MRKIRKARDYFRSPSDLFLFFEVFYFALLLQNKLKQHNLEELLEKITPSRQRSITVYRTRRIVVFVNWWLSRNFWEFRPTCLKRSLLLFHFLRREGIPVKIHYGISKNGDKLEGHSWLTLEKSPFLEDGLTGEKYKETFVYPRDES